MHDTILDIQKISSFLTKAITKKRILEYLDLMGQFNVKLRQRQRNQNFVLETILTKKKESEEETSVKKEWEVHGTNYVFR